MFVNLKKIKAMFTLYRTVFALTRKGFLFTHKNSDFGAISVTSPISGGGGSTPGNSSGGGCAARSLKPWPDFRRQNNVIFHTLFQTSPLNPYPFSDLAFRQKVCYHYLAVRAQTKNYSNPFRIRMIFISPSFLLIWNWNDTYVHTLRSSLENHTQLQTKMGKACTRFQTKTAHKPNPMGRHIAIWLM